MSEHDDDLGALRAIGTPDHVWEPPPPGLWDRIAQAVADEADGHGDDRPDAAADRAGGGVVSLADARARRRPMWFAAAAAAAVLVLGAGVLAWRTVGDGGRDVVARSPLDVLAGSGSGVAELVDDDGALQLHLVTDGLADIDGYYEVWLLNESVTGLVSLGPLRADETYDLPAGIDPSQFPIVDVSIEPFDGDPAHSSDSVLRGQLDVPS